MCALNNSLSCHLLSCHNHLISASSPVALSFGTWTAALDVELAKYPDRVDANDWGIEYLQQVQESVKFLDGSRLWSSAIAAADASSSVVFVRSP